MINKNLLSWGLMLCTVFAAVHVFSLHGKQHRQKEFTMNVWSNDFVDGKRLPDLFTCSGKNISPHLAWSAAPKGTQSFALMCNDPDAPKGNWVHWVIFNIPATMTELAQGLPLDKELSNGIRQGTNSFDKIGYGGACPPRGDLRHHYEFMVYALDAVLELPAGATKSALETAMIGHVLAKGIVTGTFSRD